MFEINTASTLDCGGRRIGFERPRIMGVVNVTPDSFSDGGQLRDTDAAVAHALRLIDEGADLLDIGGESTRPGAAQVEEAEEIARVIPVIERLVHETSVPIAVDTSKPGVMRAAIAAGVHMVNDIYALRRDEALDVVAGSRVAVCLMHMLGEPRTMQASPEYADVVGEVHRFLAERILAAQFAGIDRQRLVADPGFGFGKTLEHNLSLLRSLDRFRDLGVPLLAGLSRKSMIGALTDRPVEARLHGSVAAALIAVQHGASIVRVHDVAATRDALAVWLAVREGERAQSSRSAQADAARRARLMAED